MKVSVIILNFNLPADTISLISDLKRQSLRPEIVVVDNRSTDDSVLKIKKAHSDIAILTQPKNLGVAGGYNAGLKFALEHESDYIIASNNDLIIEQKDCLKNLISPMVKDKSIGACGPLIYFAKGYEYHKSKSKSPIIWYAGGKIDWDNILMSHHGVDQPDKGQFSRVEPTDFVTGAFMAFPAKILREVGLFNESYFAYLEDAELSTRISRAGYKLIINPTAKIYHKVSQTASGGIGGGFNDYYITRNRLKFGLQYAKWRTKLALLRETARLLFTGRENQRKAIRDLFRF